MHLVRADIVRLFSRRAAKVILIAAIVVMGAASWSNHRVLQDHRERVAEELRTPRPDLPPGYLETTAEAARLEEDRIRATMARTNLHAFTMNTFATAHGVVLAAILAATLFGAEFRWRYWRTVLLHEPRRTRVVLSKVIVLWGALAASLALLLVLAYILGAAFSAMFSFGSPGPWPALSSAGLSLLTAWLACALYGTLAAAGALWFRSSLAGLAVAMGLLLADGLTAARFVSLQGISAVQQLSSLTIVPRTRLNTVMWFPPIGETAAARGATPPSVEASLLTLSIWVAFALTAALTAMRSRDVVD